MDDSIIYLDQAGFALYLKNIENAERELREIQKYKGEVAIFQGDHWHDNPSLYLTEMNERAAIKKLNDLKNGLSKIKIIERRLNSNFIDIGSNVTVLIEFDGDCEEYTFKIVSLTSTDNFEEEVSIKSPLGSAIIGKTIGDVVEYVVNNNVLIAKILKIE